MLDGLGRDFRFCCELGQDQAQAKTDEEQGPGDQGQFGDTFLEIRKDAVGSVSVQVYTRKSVEDR